MTVDEIGKYPLSISEDLAPLRSTTAIPLALPSLCRPLPPIEQLASKWWLFVGGEENECELRVRFGTATAEVASMVDERCRHWSSSRAASVSFPSPLELRSTVVVAIGGGFPPEGGVLSSVVRVAEFVSWKLKQAIGLRRVNEFIIKLETLLFLNQF